MTSVEKADGVLGAINKILGSLGLSDFYKKLVGFGSDGAAVNTGTSITKFFSMELKFEHYNSFQE